MIDLEKAVIGAVLGHPSNFTILPEDFSSEFLSPKNAKIFNYLCLKRADDDYDFDVSDLAKTCGISPEYIIECKEIAENEYIVGWVGVVETCNILKANYDKRILKEFLVTTLNNLNSHDLDEAISQAETKIDQIRLHSSSREIESVSDMLPDFIQRLKEGKLFKPIKTGLDWFDSRHPMIEGELHVVGGLEGLCKSAFTLRIAVEMALRDSKVLYWSLEMKKSPQLTRVISMLTGLNSQDMEEDRLDDSQKTNIEDVAKERTKVMENLYLEDRFFKRGAFENIVRRYKPKFIVVDFIQQMEPLPSSSREESVASNVRWLKSLAMKYDCVVMAVSQFHRGDDKAKKREPRNSDFRESGVIEQIADGTLLIFTEEEEAKNWRKQPMIFKQGKMRRARKFRMPVEYDPLGYNFNFINQANF